MLATFFIQTGNKFLSFIGTVITTVMGLLPDSPFTIFADNSQVSSFLGGLAWVVPFTTIIAISEAWLTAILTYYAYQIVLRWVKAIN